MKTLAIPTALLASLSLVACGGGGGDGDDDITINPDAAVQPDAPEQRTCLAAASTPTASMDIQVADSGGGTPQAPDELLFIGTINQDAAPDAIAIELYRGFGVFTGGITTGTYPLTAAELNYETCGLCVRLFTDYVDGTGFAEQQFFVTGGSVTITSISPNFVGTVSNLTFEEVTIRDDGSFHSDPVPNGCTTAVAAGSFDVEVEHMAGVAPIARGRAVSPAMSAR